MAKNEKIVAFGEIMLRLTPPDYTTIAQARNFIANYGGGEANVLVSLSHLGHNTEFLTKLPDNQLGDSAIKHLKSHGVNTDHVVRGSSNIGMYFVETGFGGRPSKVLYNQKKLILTKSLMVRLGFTFQEFLLHLEKKFKQLHLSVWNIAKNIMSRFHLTSIIAQNFGQSKRLAHTSKKLFLLLMFYLQTTLTLTQF